MTRRPRTPPPWDPVLLLLARPEIEARDARPILGMLRGLVEDRDVALQTRGKLRLEVSGYWDDRRELYQIPEVRDYMRVLDEVFPYWTFFADLESDTLQVLVMCVCRVTVLQRGADRSRVIAVENADKNAFLARQAAGFMELAARFSLPDSEHEAVMSRVAEYVRDQEVIN